jgi:hypothetical protein
VGGKRREPRPGIKPSEAKRPRIAPEFEGKSDHLRPAWRFNRLDKGGPWRWRNLSDHEVHEALEKLGALEGMTWEQIKRHGSHHVALSRLCKDAKDRLVDIKLDDQDEVFSVRLTGAHRLWGIRDHHILLVLWWDPRHEVCPSLPR